MVKSREIQSTPKTDEAWKNCNIEKFFETLVKIIERRDNVKITYELRLKTEEELEKEKAEGKVRLFDTSKLVIK